MSKTNVQYLRELIEKHIGDDNKDEALEFLTAIEDECDTWSADVKDLKKEAKDWETKYDSACIERDEAEEKSGEFEIESVQDQTLLDAFRLFVDREGPLNAERILDELNRAPYLQAL